MLFSVFSRSFKKLFRGDLYLWSGFGIQQIYQLLVSSFRQVYKHRPTTLQTFKDGFIQNDTKNYEQLLEKALPMCHHLNTIGI